VTVGLCLATLVSAHTLNQTRSKGELIFDEEFNELDESKWTHFVSGWRGGNWEFQYYRNDRKNSYIKDGVLYMKPSLTADEYGEDFLYDGSLNLWDEGCQDSMNIDGGCMINAGGDFIVNPIQSAKLVSTDKFKFKYGTVEIRAQMPKGDWLWPALWMLPNDWVYGGWPTSGEIDICETRGNADLKCGDDYIGIQKAQSTLHWGPDPGQNAYYKTHWEKDLEGNGVDFADGFHLYKSEWNQYGITFSIDDEVIGNITPPSGGFWELGGFNGNNPWAGGEQMAPFDQEFYFILNLAVGGNFFPDGCINGNGEKPWTSGFVPGSMKSFWEARDVWMPTWNNLQDEDIALKIDSIKVWSADV
jgi:hypothetical protein